MVISDIRGISAEALFPLPEFLSKLGVDTSDFLSGEPTRLEFSAPDNQGNRTVSLQTTNTVSRISVPLAADGLPRLSGEHWFVYLTIRNPASPEKSFSLTLRFHKDGHWDPEPEMLVREFARAAEQGANNPVLHGFLQFAAFGANLGIAGARVAEQAENEARDLARAGVRVAKEAANDLDALANKAVRALANW